MPMPRGLVLLASLWIFASWALSVGLRRPVAPSLASYAPGVRVMVACLSIGLCAAWPLLRLSGPRQRWPLAMVLLDLVALATLVQVVIWPMRLTTAWTPTRLALIDALLFSWAALCAAPLAVALDSSDARARTFAMAACLLVCVLGLPVRLASAALGLPDAPAWLLGPVMGALELGAPEQSAVAERSWPGVAVVASLATLAWGLAWWWLRLRRSAVAGSMAHG